MAIWYCGLLAGIDAEGKDDGQFNGKPTMVGCGKRVVPSRPRNLFLVQTLAYLFSWPSAPVVEQLIQGQFQFEALFALSL